MRTCMRCGAKVWGESPSIPSDEVFCPDDWASVHNLRYKSESDNRKA
jgi:hypothetical protein